MPVQRGDAVSYVHIVDPAERLATRRVESPVMLKAHPDGVKVDRSYYLRNKLDIVRSTIELFVPVEVIDRLFSVYQFALDNPTTRTLTQAMGSTEPPPAERRARVEAALDHAIAQGRIPNNGWFPPPLPTGRRKRPPKPTATDVRRNADRMRALLGCAAPRLTDNRPAPKAPPSGSQGPKPRRKLADLLGI